MLKNGTTDKAKGKIKEITGDITGNDKKKAEGIFEQAIGKVKEVGDNIKEKTEELVEKTRK